MALRRLHWKNCLLAEILYLVNVAKVCVGQQTGGGVSSVMLEGAGLLCSNCNKHQSINHVAGPVFQLRCAL
jgi:hypothetical protein